MVYRLSLANPINITLAGHIRYRAGRTRQNCNPSDVLIYLSEGEMVYQAAGKCIRLNAGMHLLIPAGQSYTTNVVQECDYYYIHFDLGTKPVLCQDSEAQRYFAQLAHRQRQARGAGYTTQPETTLYIATHSSHGQREDTLRYHFARCEEFRYGNGALDRMRLTHSFEKILLSLAASLEQGLLPRVFPATLTRITRYIDMNYASEMSLTHLSEKFQLSKQYIMRLFRENMGITVSHYVCEVRLRKSLDMLSHTSLTISQVAYAVGFDDPHYFDRVFKKVYKLTPTQFRQKQI